MARTVPTEGNSTANGISAVMVTNAFRSDLFRFNRLDLLPNDPLDFVLLVRMIEPATYGSVSFDFVVARNVVGEDRRHSALVRYDRDGERRSSLQEAHRTSNLTVPFEGHYSRVRSARDSNSSSLVQIAI